MTTLKYLFFKLSLTLASAPWGSGRVGFFSFKTDELEKERLVISPVLEDFGGRGDDAALTC